MSQIKIVLAGQTAGILQKYSLLSRLFLKCSGYYFYVFLRFLSADFANAWDKLCVIIYFFERSKKEK